MTADLKLSIVYWQLSIEALNTQIWSELNEQPLTKVEFGEYDFRFREEKGIKQIFDPVRKKYVSLTPEEWVRQHVLHYLISKGYPASLIAVERGIEVNDTQRRFDVVVYDRESKPLIIVECKAQNETVNQNVLMQIAGYNLKLKAKYFWLTNGDVNYFIRLSDGGVLEEIQGSQEIS
jgi:hypothetical protein